MVSMNELKQDMITGMGYIGLDSGRLYRMRRGPKLIEAVASGTTIIINDAADGRPFRGLRVFGQTEQQRTTGAQLLDESKVEQNNLRAFEYINLSVGEGTFTLSSNIPKSSTDSSAYIMLISGNVQEISSENTTATNGVYKGQSRTFPSINGYVTIAYRNDADANNIINFNEYWYMLNKGAEEKPYEPYTGGKPSPSPEYPQGIVSAGEGGSITMEVGGKNLLTGRLYFTNYSSNTSYVYNEDEVTLPYTPPSETRGIGYVVPCKPGVQYTFSVTNPNKNWHLGIAEYENFEQAKSFLNKIGYQYGSEKSSIKYTAVGNGVLICMIAGKWTDGKTTIHECTESELLQLEIGSEATTYEPPRIPQTLTLQTPNGLPGVPVSKDGNYTDSNGQQWVCDEIDLGRGKYVQRIETRIFDGTEDWHYRITNSGNNNFQMPIKDRPSTDYGPSFNYCPSLCNYLPYKNTGWDDNIVNLPKIYSYDLEITASFPPESEFKSVEIWNSWLKEKGDFKFQYVLATPIERDLTPEEIAAYKALRTYSPTTVITNDAGAGMEVTYVADTKAYIDKKFKELNQAIVNTQIALL